MGAGPGSSVPDQRDPSARTWMSPEDGVAAETPGREAEGVARQAKTATGPGGRAPLSPLIHGRVRLLILSFLLRGGRSQSFPTIRKSLGLTDGTLSVNLSKLEEGGLISITKTFEGKRPVTLVRMTARGKREYARYLEDLRDILPVDAIE